MSPKKLIELGEIVNGGTPLTKIEEYWGGDIPWITPNDLSNKKDKWISVGERSITQKGLDNSNAKLIPPNSIMISTRAPIGYMVRNKVWATTNQGMKSFIPNENVDSDYIYYAIKKNIDLLNKYAGGTTFKEISTASLKSIPINVPDKEYQKKVGKTLATIDDKISCNMELCDYLNEYMQSLFHKWFVDFNFLDENNLEYKSSGGNFRNYNGYNIPYNWDVIELNEIVEKSTKSINPKDDPNKIYKYYSIPVYDDTKMYSEEIGESILSNKYELDNNNILVSKLNPWFKRVIYSCGEKGAICSTEFVVLKPLRENMLEYLFVVTNTEKFTNYCSNASSGTSNSHKRVNPDYMIKFKVPYNEEIIIKFNKLVYPMVKKIQLMLIENEDLVKTRDLLMKKLIK